MTTDGNRRNKGITKRTRGKESRKATRDSRRPSMMRNAVGKFLNVQEEVEDYRGLRSSTGGGSFLSAVAAGCHPKSGPFLGPCINTVQPDGAISMKIWTGCTRRI
jgi:hypothetical protein